MGTLWLILTQFIFRVSFGVSIAMAVTPPRLVSSGFYRVHLWVVMGMNTFAALAVYSSARVDFPNQVTVLTLSMAIAAGSFVGSAIWLYEKPSAGIVALYLLAVASLVAAALATPLPAETTVWGILLFLLDLISGGLVLGVTLAAMLLGHWYLNTPSMQLVPLKRLVLLMVGAIAARTVLCAVGLAIHLQSAGPLETHLWAFIVLRWFSGLLGTLMLAWMTWLTLRVPNTQSATGILYAGVILAFIGEMTSMLLSLGKLYPL